MGAHREVSIASLLVLGCLLKLLPHDAWGGLLADLALGNADSHPRIAEIALCRAVADQHDAHHLSVVALCS